MKDEIKEIRLELVEINKKFGSGAVVNGGSLDFAISAAHKGKDWQEQLAFVVRALLCDHVFEDGNKRTAAAYIMAVLESLKFKYDPFKIDRLVLKIAKNNVSKVEKIKRMIEHASAKNI